MEYLLAEHSCWWSILPLVKHLLLVEHSWWSISFWQSAPAGGALLVEHLLLAERSCWWSILLLVEHLLPQLVEHLLLVEQPLLVEPLSEVSPRG